MQISDGMVRAALDAFDDGVGDPNDYARRMSKALTAALSVMWQDISTAPKDELKVTSKTFMLAHAEKKWIRFGKWYVQEGCWYYSGTNERSQWAQVRGDAPTHFMPAPLPPPPKIEIEG